MCCSLRTSGTITILGPCKYAQLAHKQFKLQPHQRHHALKKTHTTISRNIHHHFHSMLMHKRYFIFEVRQALHGMKIFRVPFPQNLIRGGRKEHGRLHFSIDASLGVCCSTSTLLVADKLTLLRRPPYLNAVHAMVKFVFSTGCGPSGVFYTAFYTAAPLHIASWKKKIENQFTVL